MFLTSTFELFFKTSPKPLNTASFPIPSTVSPALTVSTIRSPLGVLAGSVMFPINLRQSGLVSLPFLYARRIFCTPETFVRPEPASIFTVTLSLFASVTYTTSAFDLSVPSSLYAPDDEPFTNPNPDLS